MLIDTEKRPDLLVTQHKDDLKFCCITSQKYQVICTMSATTDSWLHNMRQASCWTWSHTSQLKTVPADNVRQSSTRK